ncbi:carbohydrate ABC transporter permease [Alkaliphilus peptidifermentans]|uniref:Multiple sugar transport system permease protein n=1 Tax=Alkaliphilus peptidifermentans DSM 18978 TaxID=1120976 RepID=A0A1G5IT11_9FIRM|nr:sugar ABC transporter permease [Alkaliphilus peptidifermentans]SCY79233.1 multiple sugar transport system permease protein [Alkaliphilus peptidifermentans DSM 18978]
MILKHTKKGATVEKLKHKIKTGSSIHKRETYFGVLFALPVILGLIIFTIGPMIASLVLSFTNYRGTNAIEFIGFHNYIRLFNGEDVFFYKSLKVTFYYVILSVPLSLLSAFLVALLLNQDVIKGKALFRTIYYLPSIIPAVATSMIWMWLFNPDLGLINAALSFLRLPTSNWIYAEKTVIPSLVIMSLWSVGSTMVIFLAGLQSVPRSLYEAVVVDGGNVLHKFWYVTVPMMTPIIFFNLIMGCIGAFQAFTAAFIITEGGPNNASLFYNYYLYREAFQFGQMGHASAIAWILFVILVSITAVFFKWQKSWVYYESGGQ